MSPPCFHFPLSSSMCMDQLSLSSLFLPSFHFLLLSLSISSILSFFLTSLYSEFLFFSSIHLASDSRSLSSAFAFSVFSALQYSWLCCYSFLFLIFLPCETLVKTDASVSYVPQLIKIYILSSSSPCPLLGMACIATPMPMPTQMPLSLSLSLSLTHTHTAALTMTSHPSHEPIECF